jgi:methylenetetrahydrofolate reductase (NADPH)
MTSDRALTLRERMEDPRAFLVGVEVLSTRGTMLARRAVRIREFAAELARSGRVDWVSITDNAGGNPMLGPTALGKPVLYAGREVLIHLSCKDFNRNGLESQAWMLASEGFHNILALSGDSPSEGWRGEARPVFDLDSVGLLHLLREMNEGLPAGDGLRRLDPTGFFLGAAVNPFKRLENEMVPQLLKLERKLRAGAGFAVTQIGFDARKAAELRIWLAREGRGEVPVIGNVFLLNARVARVFHEGRVPGVTVTRELLEECERRAASADRGRAFFLELAARQMAVYRGLGYRGVYLDGLSGIDDLAAILDREASFGRDDWKAFARELRYAPADEFYLFPEDPQSGRWSPAYEASLARRDGPGLAYRFHERFHDLAFVPGTRLFSLGRALCASARRPEQGPAPLRWLERLAKGILFDCRDCGDCALPETAFLCPESACVKNQRNGPCGGTRDGLCEVRDVPCLWARAYDRLQARGREREIAEALPVIQDQSLRGTSGWANAFLGRDHRGRAAEPPAPPSVPLSPVRRSSP